MNKILLGLGCAAIFFYLISLLLPSPMDSRCIMQANFSNHYYKGVVKNKYIDFTQHSYPIVEIESRTDSVIKLNLVLEKNGIFEKLNIGAHIYKPKGMDTIFVIKNSKMISIGEADFGCDAPDSL